MRRLLALLGVLALGVVGIVGCGDDGDSVSEATTASAESTTTAMESTTTTTEAMTSEAYLAEANAICTSMNDELAATLEQMFTEVGYSPTSGEEMTPEQLAKFLELAPTVLEETSATIENYVTELRALEAPDEIAAETAAVYDAFDQDLAGARAIVEQMQAGDMSGLSTLVTGAVFAQSEQMATDAGLDVCGENPIQTLGS